jgi:hypothetical protein
MSDHSNSAQYRRVREEFEQMSLDERAIFLLEAAVATIIRGVDAAGRVVLDNLSGLFDDKEEEVSVDVPTEADAPPPAATKTASAGTAAGPVAGEPSGTSGRKTPRKKPPKRPSSGTGSPPEAI